MRSRFKLIAFDYDGTAAEDGQLPSARLRGVVARARAEGLRAVLATGRPFASAVGYAEALGLADPVICYQGAMVREMDPAGAVLMTEKLPDEPIAEVIALAEERHVDLNLYTADGLYVVSLCRPREFYQRWFGQEIRQFDSYADALQTIRERGEVLLKCLFIGEPSDNDVLTAVLAERFAGRLAATRSHRLFVELTSLTATKGHALAFVAQHYGIAQAQTMAVGDSGNDVSMIRWAGLGIAVANGSPEARSAADWVAPSVYEDGLAAAIERFALANGRG